MKSYKDPSFQDRVGRAAEAKQKALDALRAKPAVNEEIRAERQAARLKRETAEAEQHAVKRAQRQASEAAAAAEAEAAEASSPPTEEERKKARDARYAARKNRK